MLKMLAEALVKTVKFILWIFKGLWKSVKLAIQGIRVTVHFFRLLLSGEYREAMTLVTTAVLEIGLFVAVLLGIGLILQFVNQQLTGIMP